MGRAENPAFGPSFVDGPAATRNLSASEQQLEKADSDQRLLAQIWNADQAPEREPAEPAAAAAPQQIVRTGNRLSEATDNVPAREQGTLIEALSRQLAQRASEFGPHAPATLESQFALAAAHLDAGQVSAAIPLLETGIANFSPTTDEELAMLAGARGALGRAYLSTRQPQRAIAVYAALLGDESGTGTRSQQLGYRIKLAVAHRAGGNVTAAAEQLDALRSELEGDPTERQQLLQACVEQATTNVVAGRPRDAAGLYESALSLATELHGAEHRTTLGIRLMLARACQQAGQRVHAVGLYEQLVTDAERAVGPGDRLTRQAYGELTTLRRAN